MNCPNCQCEDYNGYGNTPWVPGTGLICSKCGWKKEQYVPSPEKMIQFPKDIEYFEEHKAPVMENLHRMHYTIVNSTIPYFGPMLYLFARQMGCEQILEIGHAEGYTSFYLANAINDNAKRFGMAGNHYYGIDIVQTETTKEKLEKEGLPVTVLNMDSLALNTETFPGVVFDLIFQDGNHDEEHVLKEFFAMWPTLKGNGDGYWIAHDAQGPAEEGCRRLKQFLKENEKNEEYRSEVITLGGMYGLMIIRKLKGLDPEKRFWHD
jgi:predicted O-methyltransferase YrrM